MQNKLRKEAEKIALRIRNTHKTNPDETDHLMQELQIHQIQMELLNKELESTSQQLKESEKRFSSLFEHAPIGYVLLDEEHNICQANYSAAVLINCEKCNLEGKSFHRFIHPDYLQSFNNHYNEVLDSENLHTLETKLKRSANDFFYARLQSVKDTEIKKGESRIRLAITDISEKKNIEKLLHRYKLVLNSSIDSILLVDFAKGNFIEVNDSACCLLGFARQEFLDMKPEQINSAYTLQFMRSLFIDSQNKIIRETYDFESTHIRKDGRKIYIEVYLKLISIEEQQILVAIAKDITERKHTEEKLLVYTRELQELNASKDKFLSIISHDLRGPFLGIKGYTQMLLEDYDMLTKEEITEYLQNIQESTNDLYSLVDNLLKWSRLELGKIPYEPMTFNLQQELEPVLKLLSGIAAKKEIKIDNQIRKEVYPVADRLMLVSVIQNLISNAIKFTRKGGKIKLKCTEASGLVTLSIEDNGIGIKPEVMEKLFTLDKAYNSKGTAGEKGTGFGLLIAREMVLKMGGNIWAESQPEKGSIFYFTLQNSR